MANSVNITGGGGSSGAAGWFQAGTLSFAVLPSSAGNILKVTMPAISSNLMVNNLSVVYSNFSGMFADSRGGWTFSFGQLLVLNPAVVGIYSYSSSRCTFVNTFELNGATSTDAMIVRATYNTGRPYAAYMDVNVQPSVCNSASSLLLTSVAASGCSVALKNAPGGFSSVSVTAQYNGLNTSLAYRAFYLMSYSLSASRSKLRRLGCDYETTYLSAYGGITLNGAASLATIDISNIVTFKSSNPTVVNVTGRLAKGLGIGTAVLSYGGVSFANVSVSASSASILQLVSFAYSSASVSPALLNQTELAIATVRVQPILSLTAELQVLTIPFDI